MSESTTAGARDWRLATLFIGLLLAASLLAPQRAAAEVGFEDTPPVISNGVLSPTTLPYTGDQVRIDVDIADDFGVFMAYAAVYGPEGIVENVMLIPSKIDETGVGGTFSGSFNAPPNYTDSPVGYGVEVQATDTAGGTDYELIGTFEVEAQPQPANLTVAPDSLDFGAVRIGQQAGQWLLLTNTAPPSSAPIAGTLIAAGDAFALAKGESVGFRLKPGQSKRYRVEFRPSTLGLQTGTATILPASAGEPDIAVPLSGQGVARR